MGRVEGKVAIIPGAASGLGEAGARLLAAEGASVIMTDINESQGRLIADEIGAEFVEQDVSQEASWPGLVDQVMAKHGRLDVLVNNAGTHLMARDEWKPEIFEEAVRINLVGAFRLAVRCKPLLTASKLDGGASVLNVASMSSFVAVPFVPGYGAAKAGVVQLTKNLGVAWAGEGIRVNAVAPGLIETNMTAAMKGVAQLEQPELARTPMGRWGTPDDVTPAFLFLASPDARFITGQTLCVDGGYSVR